MEPVVFKNPTTASKISISTDLERCSFAGAAAMTGMEYIELLSEEWLVALVNLVYHLQAIGFAGRQVDGNGLATLDTIEAETGK